MTLRSRLRAATVAALLVGTMVAAPHRAGAAETLDQQQTGANSGLGAVGYFSGPGPGIPEGEYRRAQTVTAGLTGGLTRVDLIIGHATGTTNPLVVEIRNVEAGGAPGATVLTSVLVPAAATNADVNSGTPVPVVFATPAHVVAGTAFAIVLRASDPSETFFVWGGTGGYAGGSDWVAFPSSPNTWVSGDSFDLWFKTYVDPAIVPVSPPAFDSACDANGVKTGYNTIAGTAGADELVGTPGRDLIYGFGGNDVIKGRGGNDLICAGAGRDLVVAGDNGDVVFGGAGNDRIRGGGGNDRLHGGDGNDLLIGGNGRDRLYGDGGADTLRGNAGADQLNGGTGRDVLRGGDGADVLIGGPARDDISG